MRARSGKLRSVLNGCVKNSLQCLVIIICFAACDGVLGFRELSFSDGRISDGTAEDDGGSGQVVIDSITVPVRIGVGDSVSVQVAASGKGNESVTWTVLAGCPSLVPSAGTLTLDGAGHGSIDLNYTASAVAGDVECSVDLSGATASLSMKVRNTVALGEFVAFANTAGLAVAANYLVGQKIIVPTESIVLKLGLHVQFGGYDGRMALYTDQGGVPGVLVESTVLRTLASGRNDMAIPAVSLSAGSYWVMGVFSASASVLRHSSLQTTISAAPWNIAFSPPSMTSTSSMVNRTMNYYMLISEN